VGEENKEIKNVIHNIKREMLDKAKNIITKNSELPGSGIYFTLT
jgi:hypothetical protein